MKGFKSIQAVSDGTGKSKTYESIYKLTYLELPILLIYNISVNWPVKPSLFVGPYVSYKLSSKIKHPRELYGSEESDWEYPKNTDFGFVIGSSASFKIISLEVRYIRGLTSFEGFRMSGGAKSDTKNNVFSIILGLSF